MSTSSSPSSVSTGSASVGTRASSSDELAGIFDIVRSRRGVDLTCYRPTTVQRRLRARMQRVGHRDFSTYLGLLEHSEGEVDALLSSIRIGVTRFLRNAAAFDVLASTVLPTLAGSGRPLHIWSAGCSTGEEPYSLLITLAELVGDECVNVALTASDVEGRALLCARPEVARYAPQAVEEMPEALRTRYLEFVGGPRPEYRPNDRLVRLAECVRWVQHDLLSAVPLNTGPFDLVSCRNVLIYFSREEQRRIQWFLASTLAPGGYLFLGEAESLSAGLTERFEVIDSTSRLFRLRSDVVFPGGE